MINSRILAGAVRAALRYGSVKQMRLQLRNTDLKFKRTDFRLGPEMYNTILQKYVGTGSTMHLWSYAACCTGTVCTTRILKSMFINNCAILIHCIVQPVLISHETSIRSPRRKKWWDSGSFGSYTCSEKFKTNTDEYFALRLGHKQKWYGSGSATLTTTLILLPLPLTP
jgi:hypothetical protein